MSDKAIDQISGEELLQLSAVSSAFYGEYWFPKTVRQQTPEFHVDMDRILEHPDNRYVAFEIFRGGAKTTKLRLFTSKRIAFGISHTILYVGKSQDHAIRSVEWLKKAVDYNTRWAQFFQLRRGEKWTGEEIEIYHGTDEYPIRVLAVGIEGSIRGINIDDYRPDLIVLDDPCDEMNTATFEGRQKIDNLVYGALMKSLAPRSEAPEATIALAQTPLNEFDLISKAMNDPQWAAVRFGCFDNRGESRWKERWSTEELLEDKKAHINRNQLSLWLREMECVVVTDENAAFSLEWLVYHVLAPDHGLTFITIDPTPPPKDSTKVVINDKLDDAVIMVTRYYQGRLYILEYYLAKSPDPEEFINKFFELAAIYRPFQVGVETTLFQRMLKWYIEKEARRRRKYYTFIPVEDKRKKETRIIQAITAYASNGALSVKKDQTEFIEQYGAFRAQISGQRDDMLDALSIAISLLDNYDGELIEGEYEVVNEEAVPDQIPWQGAP